MSIPNPKRIEIKVSFAGEVADQAIHVFGLADADAKKRRIWFSEIPVPRDQALPLSARGIILRVRLARRKADITLKLRGPNGCIDTTAWADRTSPWGSHATLEGDWAGDRHLASAALQREIEADDDIPPPREPADVTKMLSAEQRDLAREWMIPLDLLVPLGPIVAHKWEGTIAGISKELAFERWAVADALRFLKISLRADGTEATSVQRQLEKAIRDHDLSADAASATKTETVLRWLAAQ